MNKEERDNIIRTFLAGQGYRPRVDKDVDNYVRQLRFRLRKQGKDLFIQESDNNINIYIGEKQKKEIRTKRLEVKRYKEYAKLNNISLSKLVRDLLDKEINDIGEM